jgi:acyl-CoA synthetase (AMP-forming)/AMP-acid ligase II
MLSRESRLVGKGSPFELVDTALNGLTYRTYRHGPKTLNDLYQRGARAPNREFLIHCDRRLTNTAILQQGSALGRLLKESFHISSGMRVGLQLRNGPEWLIGFIAITSIGGTAVALPVQADLTETMTALEVTGCSLVIASREAASLLADAGYRGSVIGVNEKAERDASSAFPFALDASSSTSATLHAAAIDPEQLALISFTSGSTGRSKGVMINHRSLMHGIMNMLLGAALSGSSSSPNDRPSGLAGPPISLLTAPFSHVSGYSHLLLMLFLGGKVIALPDWDPNTVPALIKREAVTSIAGATPAMIRELILSDRAPDTLSSLRSVGMHGVSLVPGLLAEIGSRLPYVAVNTSYGMTETNGAICAISGAQLTQRPTSGGRPLPTVDIRIKQNDRVGHGPAGELLVRGPMLMQGYCGQSVDDSSPIAREWFSTGDFGFIDGDGFVHVTDRTAHVIVCEGHIISCGAVEKSLLDSALVKDVAVFGGPELHHGNRLVVIAVPNGDSSQSEQLILERTATVTHSDLLEPHIILIKELPHTATGKIDRRQLKHRYQAQKIC